MSLDKSLEFFTVLSLGCKVNIVNNNNSNYYISLELKGRTVLIRLVKTAYYLYMRNHLDIKKNNGNQKALRKLLNSTLKNKYNSVMSIMYRRDDVFKQTCTYDPNRQTSTLRIFFAKLDYSITMQSLMKKMKKDLKEKKSIGSLADTTNSENIKVAVAILGAIFDDNTMAFDETLVQDVSNDSSNTSNAVSNINSSTDTDSDYLSCDSDPDFVVEDDLSLDSSIPPLEALQPPSSQTDNTPAKKYLSIISTDYTRFLYEMTTQYWIVTPRTIDRLNSRQKFTDIFESYCEKLCKTCRDNNFCNVLKSKKQTTSDAFKTIYDNSCEQCKEHIYSGSVCSFASAKLYGTTVNLLLNKNFKKDIDKRSKKSNKFHKQFITLEKYKTYKKKLCSKSQ